MQWRLKVNTQDQEIKDKQNEIEIISFDESDERWSENTYLMYKSFSVGDLKS
jgi:hypothetical protein